MSENQGRYYPIFSVPGIQKDGTIFNGKNYIDGQWVRFYNGNPRKIGGYKLLVGDLPNPVRGLYITPTDDYLSMYIGDQSSLKKQVFDENGNLIGGLVDVTPVGFTADPNNVWQFTDIFSTISNSNTIIASAPPNLFSINNATEKPIYYGTVGSNTPLVPTGIIVSGGICVFQPFLFMFGNSGDVKWSEANDPTTIMGEARIASQKIVTGLPMRGGDSAPAGLLWSLDSVIRVTQAGVNDIEFRFDTISSQSSILSSRSIIEHDGLYLWAGVDRFLAYDGSVREVPNNMNLNYFYLNLDTDQREKVWATKVPQYGEIWFFGVSKNSPNGECDIAVIYNLRERCWYNAEIARGSGYFAQVFADPVWSDCSPDVNNAYSIWWHEKGVDKNVNDTLTAIPSSFTTGSIAWCAVDPAKSYTGLQRDVDLESIEPDFILRGDMTVTVLGKKYANDDFEASDPKTFNSTTEKIDMRQQRREMYLRFDSNTVGGFYEHGRSIMLVRFGDVRP